MRRSLQLAWCGVLALACRPSPPDRHPPDARSGSAPPTAVTSSGAQAPDSTPPANVSHGEARVGPPGAPPAPVGADLPPLAGVQTVNVPVGGGSIFEIRLREPGDYPFVSHAFADATKGAVGVLRALPSVAGR